MAARDEVSARIMRLLRDSLLLEPSNTNTDLIEGGVIDSAGFMELFVLLENEFGIQIELADLDLDHFRTVQDIASFVINKQMK